MASLTTASQVSEFRQDILSEQQYKFTQMIPHLTVLHKEKYDPSRSGGWRRGADLPDEEALFTAYSTVLIILFKLVDDMEMAEDILEGLLEDADDEEQIMHTQGELFALKTTYLSITGMVDSIESNRLDLSAMGTPSPKIYFKEVLRSGGLAAVGMVRRDELIPSKYQMVSNPFASLISGNTISFNPPKVPSI